MKNIETIEKQGEPKIQGVTNCKSYRKALQTLIGNHYKKGHIELEFYTRGLLELYNKFHPEKVVEVTLEKWKGKSSFELIKGIDKLTIIKYQKATKESEPQEVRTEVSREELQAIIESLKHLDEGNPIKTRILAMDYSNRLQLGHPNWKMFFADRHNHNKITLILGALDFLGLIKYSGGKTTILNKQLSIQLIL